MAKTDAAHRGLAEQFAERDLQKEYVALVAGVPRLLSGSIDTNISRHPVHRHRMTTGEAEGKPARTDWKLIEAFPVHRTALVRCRIHTGRTHQIRVHMKSIGHPLLGDRSYGWKPTDSPKVEPPRIMLHAAFLKFVHPVTGEPQTLEAALPVDFEALLAKMRTASA